MKKIIFYSISILLLIVFFIGCKHEPVKNTYCFEKEILPIVKTNCANAGCHDIYDSTAGYVLDSYSSIIKKGIVIGNAAASLLYKTMLSTATQHVAVNPYPVLDTKSIEMISTWINEGALNFSGCNETCISNTTASFSNDVMPLMRTYCYGCHNAIAAPDFGGGTELSNYATIQSQSLTGQLIPSIEHNPSVFSGMPKGLAKLSNCQINIIKKWVAAGAPNN